MDPPLEDPEREVELQPLCVSSSSSNDVSIYESAPPTDAVVVPTTGDGLDLESRKKKMLLIFSILLAIALIGMIGIQDRDVEGRGRGVNIVHNDTLDTQAPSTSPYVPKNSDFFTYPEIPAVGSEKRIIMDLGLPRTGTTTFVAMMKQLFPGAGGEFTHYHWGWEPEDLLEILMLGNRSSPDNAIYKMLTQPPQAVRAVADLPAFLLSPIAKDFPNVYWIQVRRGIEGHIKSTRFMLQKWAQDRCKCRKAPRCVISKLQTTDRLYNDKYNAIGTMCKNNGNAAKIPEELLRNMILQEENEIIRNMRGHPRFLQLTLEDGTEANMKKMAEFLHVNITWNIQYDTLHQNKGVYR